jgi:hypothetical protein
MIEIPDDPTGNFTDRVKAYEFNGWYNGTEVVTDIAEDIGILSGNVTYTADYTVTYDLVVICNEIVANPDFSDEFSFYNDPELMTSQTGQTAHFTISMDHTKPGYGDYNYVISLNGTRLTDTNVGFDETDEVIVFSFSVPNCRDNPDMEDGLEITIEKVYLVSIFDEEYGLPKGCITASGTGLMDDATPNFGPAEVSDSELELAHFYIYSGGQVAFTVNSTKDLPASSEYGSYKYVVDPFMGDDSYEEFNGIHEGYNVMIIESAVCTVNKVLLVDSPESSDVISGAASEAAANGAKLILTGSFTVTDSTGAICPIMPDTIVSDIAVSPTIYFTDQFTLTLEHDLVFNLEDDGYLEVWNNAQIINKGNYHICCESEDISFYGFEDSLLE